MSDLLFTTGECSLGSLLIARSECGVRAILLGDDPGSLVRELAQRYPLAAIQRACGATPIWFGPTRPSLTWCPR